MVKVPILQVGSRPVTQIWFQWLYHWSFFSAQEGKLAFSIVHCNGNTKQLIIIIYFIAWVILYKLYFIYIISLMHYAKQLDFDNTY